jgi:hypothetical protein
MLNIRLMDKERSSGSNVSLGTGKLFRSAPTAKSGGGVPTRPHEDDAMEKTGMHEDIPFDKLEPVVDDEAEPVREP